MSEALPIITSRSAIRCHQTCPRRGYWQYEAPNGTPTPGWERRKLNVPYSTGIYTHRGLHQGFLTGDWVQAAQHAKAEYLKAVAERGLAVDDNPDEAAVIDEQAHHCEAMVLGFGRVRAPQILAEHEVVELETESPVPLSDDVVLATRADMVTVRKSDRRKFVWNFKTVGTVDSRWLKSWEVDMQLMTELLAAERRHGQEFGGVIIEGLVKGRRVQEKNNVGDVIGYRDASPLLYGYKVDANPPLQSVEYGWEYTRRKGWYRFAAWRENFGTGQGPMSPLAYWINWLPEEVVAEQFVTVPPIMRDAARIAGKVRQIVAMARRIRDRVDSVAVAGSREAALDEHFDQNENECYWPYKCAAFDLCWTHGVAEDPAGSGLYQPRVDHHKEAED